MIILLRVILDDFNRIVFLLILEFFKQLNVFKRKKFLSKTYEDSYSGIHYGNTYRIASALIIGLF